MKKFYFKKIQQRDLLLFDKNYAKLVFDGITHEEVNLSKFNVFSFFKFLGNFFRFFFKLSFRDIYLKTILDLYNPKAVISHHIDGYSYRVKNLNKKIFCVVYQHSMFYEYEKKIYKKLFDNKSCDLFITFHPNDAKFLKQLINAKFISLGSLKNNELKLESKTNKTIPLLFISEYRKDATKLHYEQLIKTCQYIKQFCDYKNIVPYVALSSNREDKLKYNFKTEELEFYKQHLKNFSWLKECSYTTANKSNLIISLSSNMGIEILSRKLKIVFFNLIGDKDNLQENPYFKDRRPKYFFSKINSNEIINKLNFFYNLNDSDWKKELNESECIIPFDEGNIKLKRELIKIIDEK